MWWLAILFAFETGVIANEAVWNEQEYIQEDGSIKQIEEHQFFANFDIRFLIFEKFFIGGEIENVFVPSTVSEPIGFKPIRDSYMFEAGLRLEKIEIGWSHTCSHPVAANWQNTKYLGSEYASDKIYIRFETEW